MSEKTSATAKTTTTTSEAPAPASRESAGAGMVRSPHARVLSLQQTVGNRAVQRLLQSDRIQAKLKIGQPNDAYEQEADRMADRIMRMPEEGIRHLALGAGKGPAIQTKPG